MPPKPKANPITPDRLREVLASYRYQVGCERDLQDGIAQVLAMRGLAFDREVVLTPKDRPDFMVDGIAVEAKVDGSPAEVLRQLRRYLCSERVRAVVLVTRKLQHAHRFPAELGGKPVRVVTLEASSL